MLNQTCGSCRFGKRIPQDLRMVVCHGLPPVPVVVGVQNTPQGPQPALQLLRPNMATSEPACALWAFELNGHDMDSAQGEASAMVNGTA